MQHLIFPTHHIFIPLIVKLNQSESPNKLYKWRFSTIEVDSDITGIWKCSTIEVDSVRIRIQKFRTIEVDSDGIGFRKFSTWAVDCGVSGALLALPTGESLIMRLSLTRNGEAPLGTL
jgi:hypothetical protein